MNFALVIPCYNYSSGIERTFARISEWRAIKAPLCHVYFVNDGSTDDTLFKLRAFAEANNQWCHVVNLEKNQGKGAAVKAGFMAASKQHAKIVFTDCDIHYGLDVICDRVLPGLEHNDVVTVDRSWVDEARGQRFVRRISSALFNKAAGTLTGVMLHDTQAGLKGYCAETCLPVFDLLRIKSFSFDVEVLSIALFYRLRVLQVPITFDRNYDFPQTSTIRIVRTSLKMLRDLLRINFNWKTGRYRSAVLAGNIDKQIYKIR